MLLHTPLPDFSAFDAESSIEKKRRGQRSSLPHAQPGSHPAHPVAYPFPPPGAAVPALASALPAAAAIASPHPAVGAYARDVPAFLSSSHGRPVCPSTPMKSPAAAHKLFHTQQGHRGRSSSSDSGPGSSMGSALSMGLSAAMMCSPTQHVSAEGGGVGSGALYLSSSVSARRKSRTGSSTPYSRPSSGSGTPRGEKRKLLSSSGEMLAALSRPQHGMPASAAPSPDRRSQAGLTPSTHAHSLDTTEDSVCSSMAHSPLMSDPFLLSPPSSGVLAPALLPSSLGASGANSLNSSTNSSWSAQSSSRGPARFGPGVGIMGQMSGAGSSGGMGMGMGGVGHGMQRLSMSTGHGQVRERHILSSSTRRPSGSLNFSSATATPSIPAPPSRFTSTFLNLGCIGRGSFGLCYHVLQIAPSPSNGASITVVGQEYAVKKSIRAFKGENDRSQKLREVENWRLLMSSSLQQQQQQQPQQQQLHHQQHPTSLSLPPSPVPPICPSLDHLHLVRYYDAWEESSHLFIQCELFRCGTVRHFLSEVLDGPVDEELLWLFLLDLARGLRFLHNRAQLVHLDLKWDNCFIATSPSPESSTDGSLAEEEALHSGILKIGDFGLSVNLQARAQEAASGEEHGVGMQDEDAANAAAAPMHFPSTGSDSWDADSPVGTSPIAPSSSTDSPLWPPAADVAEGDQTYLAPEFMDPSLVAAGSDAARPPADMFSLGMMLFEAAFDVELPRRGQAWIDLRNERIDWSGRSYGAAAATAADGSTSASSASPRSEQLLSIIRRLLCRSPSARLTAEELLADPTLIKFARGERGVAQRSMLRHLPSLLPPVSQARETAARLQAEAQAQAQTQTHAHAQPDAHSPSISASLPSPMSELDAELLSFSQRQMGHSTGLRSTRSRTAAAAASAAHSTAAAAATAAAPAPCDDDDPSLSLEEGLTPKNLFHAFQAADDE